MARLIRCIEGHVYDAEQYASCPRCAPVGEPDPGTSAGAARDMAAATEAPPISRPQTGSRRPIIAGVLMLGIGAAGAGYWLSHRPEPAPPPPNPQPVAAPTQPARPAATVTTARPTADVASEKPEPSRTAEQPQLAPARPAVSNGAPATLPPPVAPSRQAVLEQTPQQGAPSSANAFDGEKAEKILMDLQQGGAMGAGVISIARYALGAGLADHGQPDAGEPLIAQAAKDGVASAAAALAHGYLTGSFGLPRNPEQARPWAEFAAARGEPNANFDLATMEDDGGAAGRSASRDHFLSSYLAGYPAAMILAQKAKQGDAAAADVLSGFGLDPKKLPPTIAFLYGVAGRRDAARMRQQLAAYPKSIAVASYFLATMLWNGEGGARDRRAALPLFFYAAEAGYVSGLIYVAAGMLDGTVGQPLPYPAAILLAIAQMSTLPPTISGLDAVNLYNRAQQELSPQQRDAIHQFEQAIRRFAKPGSIFASRKD